MTDKNYTITHGQIEGIFKVLAPVSIKKGLPAIDILRSVLSSNNKKPEIEKKDKKK